MSLLVSAIIPTKNRAGLLQRALQSVFSQSYRNIEIVVVNDGSSDQTSKLLEEYKKSDTCHLLVIENESSVGAAQARNQAIEAASGEFIAGLDDDDSWHEDRISELIKAYSDEFACITSDMKMVYPNFEAVWKKKSVIDLETLLYTNQVGNQVLVRRERLLEINGFDPHLKAAQDYDLWIRLSERYGPIRNIQEPLQTIYMDHQEKRITDTSSFEGYYQFYKKHKSKMNRGQRKYQLYKIRRAQHKSESFYEFLNFVPAFRYWKEIKRIAMGLFN